MPRKKFEEEKPIEEGLFDDELTEDAEKDELPEEKKPRKRKRKDVPVFVFADGLQMKALYYIDLFGVTDPPMFVNVIETEFEVEEDKDEDI